ncbi:expressed unknown protein [Seminavis robusta]|uniref:Uncharacterized protein n=1 Tax=Seminavis robusta TaxID=568900 RepID=A0A9N8EYU1_9STRA|nr:expressed unknown protein [Seminavis robusta]|eukprot:Sro2009_g310710.1 n/a (636) ;mRNA; f:7301-9208
MALLLNQGCLPWTGPNRGTSTRKKSSAQTKLHYSENVTTDIISNGRVPRNQSGVDAFSILDDESDFDSILFAAGDERQATVSSLPTVARQPTKNSSTRSLQDSVHQAIDQVHGIMDLYELAPQSVASEIVMAAVDGVIHKISKDNAHLHGDGCIIEKLEALVWRSSTLQVPLGSIMSLKMLLTMQLQAHEWFSRRQSADSNQQYIDRAAKILLQYCQGSSSMPQGSFLWPNEDIRSLFRFATTTTTGMTSCLWELFEYLHEHVPHQIQVQEIRRECFKVLAISGELWSKHQYKLLLDLEQQYLATNNTRHLVGDEELGLALSYAATAGDALLATWLFRKLYPREGRKQRLWGFLLEAYANSNEEGSIAYMEQLVRSEEETQHRDLYNIVLRARARRRSPGSGLLAEEFLMHIEHLMNDSEPTKKSSLQPNMETAYHIASAYLWEEPLTFRNVADADSSVRRLCSSYNLTRQSKQRSWPVFEELLDYYAELAQRGDHRAIPSAIDLCRFYLLQHRDERILESPSSRHLESILSVLNQMPLQRNAETSVEFFRLFEQLEQTDLVSVAIITTEAICTLLDTLARSDERAKYGDLAEELFERALEEADELQADEIETLSKQVARCQTRTEPAVNPSLQT